MTYNPKQFYIQKRLEQKLKQDYIRKIKIITGVIIICLIILIMP